jgi:hypothetical protein
VAAVLEVGWLAVAVLEVLFLTTLKQFLRHLIRLQWVLEVLLAQTKAVEELTGLTQPQVA